MKTFTESLIRTIYPRVSNSASQTLRALVRTSSGRIENRHHAALLGIGTGVSGAKLKVPNVSPKVTHKAVTAAQSRTSSSGGGSGVSQSLLGNVLGLFPLVSGIARLFGGGSSTLPALPVYKAPASKSFDVAVKGGVIGDATYGNSNVARLSPVTEQALTSLTAASAAQSSGSSARTSGVASQNEAPVQTASGFPGGSQQTGATTFDNQFFLDHAPQIALAVREAMLNMNSLNDVVNDL